MFNTFIAEKTINQNKKLKKQQRRKSVWFQRYKTEIRPNLVQRYERRINGFARKMDDQPFVLNEEEKPIIQKLFRAPNHKLNISDKSFKFKNIEDWKSLFSPCQRAERQKQLKSARQKEQQFLALRSIGSQSKYSQQKIQYRIRDRSKDINPPMKYTNKNSKAAFQALPSIQKKQIQVAENRARRQTQNHLSRQSFSSDAKQSENANISDMDIASLYNSSMHRKKQHMKTQLQLIQQEQLKALAHGKLYFKSLQQKQLNMKQRKQKQQMKNVLRKCNVVKKIKTEVDKKDQLDNLLEMMKLK